MADARASRMRMRKSQRRAALEGTTLPIPRVGGRMPCAGRRISFGGRATGEVGSVGLEMETGQGNGFRGVENDTR